MLVQNPPTTPKPHQKSSQTHLADNFPRPKPITLPKWVSINLFKITTFSILTLTIAALFFLHSSSDSSSTFLCFNSRPKKRSPVELPKISFKSIKPISDKSSVYASFRSERWIVVSVSDYPSDSLQKLVKIRGWQVLAIGNSKTPSDWKLKGVIFLSLEEQANLGFRVLDHLPYDSYLRKSVGYLFAIQHGAKLIFDADDRGEVIGGDLGKHFDLKLSNVDVMQERILQYNRQNVNRSVLNPYVHFGQRSVWPRGLPLENVGEVAHEEYYTEVFGGMQYIQQGISNGLPDVDSVFYFTRKLDSEAFDIRFDEHAPKVSLPQGIMAPLNSFNTLFHSNAFWALMLPVSVSSMASDVLRGYWAQRLLWEVGGHVVVYPPTVHRDDKIESYPFVEEKDLHVNVGRLITFLASWRSNKHLFFKKILDLSYSLAVEGFWTEKDLKFTAAWLEDLLSVGYIQPKLKAIELDRPRPAANHADRREFFPQKLPSVHLGVKESETVNYEIGSLVRWKKNFGNVVLIMYVDGPVEGTALKWRLLYGRIFKTVVILSGKANADLSVEQAPKDQVYKYLPKIFNSFTSSGGFLFLQGDTILNYWNLMQADKSKLWITNKVSQSWTTLSINGDNSEWNSKQADMVKKVVSSMPVHLQVSYKENSKEKSLTVCSSEVFYIPRLFVGDFVDLVGLVDNFGIHHTVAVPMFFMAMDSALKFDSVLSKMIYKPKETTDKPSNFYSAQVPAVHPWTVSNEADFMELMRVMAAGDPLLMDLV
ncbi:probable glycosyltransferase STELLO1 [Ziziphus jujuba]|uniref:Probable glycosyltransferase STELLO1 n=1 Tax=Ziziphus jujuba TaxID=326968 RepID=A0A6P4B6S5_ZIZJJ|nr:probable glycosyltransferase STELLO1 [Ziziphus jujuba]